MNLTSWMSQTLSVRAPSGSVDVAGRPTLAALTTVKCRVEPGSKWMNSPTSSELVEITTVWTLAPLGLGSRVFLPGADTSDASQAKRVLTSTYVPNKTDTQRLYRSELQ